MKLNLIKKQKLLRPVTDIIKLIKSNDYQVYLVGGTVRDLILNRPIDNFDLATDALPGEVEKILKKGKYITKDFGKKFGTIFTVSNGFPIEITTFRSESRYSDRRHPDYVKFETDYLVDSKRRDFTINSMYLDLDSGEVLDPQKGMKDLSAKLIRFVGKATDRIDEDGLRMLRGVRLSAQLNFKLEKNSFAAIKTRVKYIQTLPGERIKPELDKIILSDMKVKGIKLLNELGLLRFLIPDFHKLNNVYHNSKRYHLEGSVFAHTLLGLNYLHELDTNYAFLFHDYGKNYTGKKIHKDGEWVNKFFDHQKVSAEHFKPFAERLKFSAKSKRLISWLIEHHDDRLVFRQSSLRKQLDYVQHPYFEKMLDIWLADSMANLRLGEDGKEYSRPSEAVTLGKQLTQKLNSKKNLILKLANGDKIMAVTKQKESPKIKHLRSIVVEQIYLNSVKDESSLKRFLSKAH